MGDNFNAIYLPGLFLLSWFLLRLKLAICKLPQKQHLSLQLLQLERENDLQESIRILLPIFQQYLEWECELLVIIVINWSWLSIIMIRVELSKILPSGFIYWPLPTQWLGNQTIGFWFMVDLSSKVQYNLILLELIGFLGGRRSLGGSMLRAMILPTQIIRLDSQQSIRSFFRCYFPCFRSLPFLIQK